LICTYDVMRIYKGNTTRLFGSTILPRYKLIIDLSRITFLSVKNNRYKEHDS